MADKKKTGCTSIPAATKPTENKPVYVPGLPVTKSDWIAYLISEKQNNKDTKNHFQILAISYCALCVALCAIIISPIIAFPETQGFLTGIRMDRIGFIVAIIMATILGIFFIILDVVFKNASLSKKAIAVQNILMRVMINELNNTSAIEQEWLAAVARAEKPS